MQRRVVQCSGTLFNAAVRCSVQQFAERAQHALLHAVICGFNLGNLPLCECCQCCISEISRAHDAAISCVCWFDRSACMVTSLFAFSSAGVRLLFSFLQAHWHGFLQSEKGFDHADLAMSLCVVKSRSPAFRCRVQLQRLACLSLFGIPGAYNLALEPWPFHCKIWQ